MGKIIIEGNYEGTEELLSINILQTTGLPFHMTPDEMDCRHLAEHWSDTKCEMIYVSFREGVYRVIEGQKRTIAAKIRFVDNKSLLCMVRRDLKSIDDEAKWFYELNHQKMVFSETKEGFLARKYFDEKFQTMVSLVENNGLHISYDNTSTDGYISRLTTLEKIYDDFIEYSTCDEFGKMIKMLHESCIGAKESLTASFLKGFAIFYRAYINDIDVSILRKCFVIDKKKEKKSYVNSKIYSEIMDDSEKYKQEFSKVGKAIAVSIRNSYNKVSRRRDNQLKLSKLEELECNF